MSDLTFLPWTRAGASAALNPSAVAGSPARPNLDIGLRVTSTAAAAAQSVHVSMHMLGPGDVTGINASQVIRTEPADGATGVESEIFPAVEFLHPALPWLFSPVVESATHQLRPWLALVVVRDQPGVSLDSSTRRLTIQAPADPNQELPDLREAHAWAHVQYSVALEVGATTDAVARAMKADPSVCLSRLISPRKLRPWQHYIACVVPTWKVVGQALQDAWVLGSTGAIDLPVYFSFAFATGEGGDFQSLATALLHRPGVTEDGSGGLGTRTMDLTHTGFAWPVVDGHTAPATLPLPGILRPADTIDTLPNPPQLAEGLLVELVPTGGSPQLRPPAYGATAAGVPRRDLRTTGTPRWLTELNCDPRLRVAAGLGAQVVAAQQEELVAAAWQQVEQAREVNALLSRAQLARIVGKRHADRHLAAQPSVGMLQLTNAHATRMQIEAPAPGGGNLVGTPWALVRGPGSGASLAAVVSGAYRRMSRPRGPIARRVAQSAPPSTQITTTAVLAGLAPGAAVENRVLNERLSPPAVARAQNRPDPLRELAVDISYDAGMVVPLAKLSPDAVLAGMDAIPSNTALSLGTNPAVIAAYMVGLNHAVARELVWRGVPMDRRATPFRRFWDVRGQAGTDPDLDRRIAEWDPASTLAVHVGGQQLVLAVRADLFRRYPRTAVYAVAADPQLAPDGSRQLADESDPRNVHAPIFTATLPPDLRVFGFDIAPADAIGNPGYFFVLQEQASETRFGCEASISASYWSISALQTQLAGQLNASSHSATVADAVRLPPVRCAIHAAALLPGG
jgi:hypothetical protein